MLNSFQEGASGSAKIIVFLFQSRRPLTAAREPMVRAVFVGSYASKVARTEIFVCAKGLACPGERTLSKRRDACPRSSAYTGRRL